jgi:two-component sensor histidine kinase
VGNFESRYTSFSSGNWRPLPLGYLLERYGLFDKRVAILLTGWIVLFAISLSSIIYLVPSDWSSLGDSRQAVSLFLLFYPPLLVCNFLLFWMGFEWGFIPAYLSTFMVALASNMPVQWAMLFGIAVVLGMAIFALVYHSTHFKYTLNGLTDLAFFVGVAFVASMASSLGSLIWSHVQELTIEQTLIVWKSWWTGTFLQIVFINAPILYLTGDRIERLKDRYFEIPERQEVSLGWVYSSIIAVVAVLSIFILSAERLGTLRIQEVLSSFPSIPSAEIIGASETFKLTTWISIVLLVAAGLSAIRLVEGWNKRLKEQVQVKRGLIAEIHHRVKNNMQLVCGLLELQMRNTESESILKELRKSHSRIYSMAKVHEQTYQHEETAEVEIGTYVANVVGQVEANFAKVENITFELQYDPIKLTISQAVTFGLLLNELLTYICKQAVVEEKEKVSIYINSVDHKVYFKVQSDGTELLPSINFEQPHTLDITLIKRLVDQLNADLTPLSDMEGATGLEFSFEKK